MVGVFVLWGPALEHWDWMTESIRERFEVVDKVRDVAFPLDRSSAFGSLVLDIYSGHDLYHIIAKLTNRLMPAPLFVRAVTVEGDSQVEVDELKALLRKKVADMGGPPVNHFVTCHASSSPEDARLLRGIFSDVSIWHTFLRRSMFDPKHPLRVRLQDAENILRARGVNKRDAVVVGSSVLEVCGLRTATDLDLTVLKDVRDSKFDGQAQELTPGVDLVYEGYHRTLGSKIEFSDDALILDSSRHFWFAGWKFAGLGIVRDRKEHDQRTKDQLDVMLIDDLRRGP